MFTRQLKKTAPGDYVPWCRSRGHNYSTCRRNFSFHLSVHSFSTFSFSFWVIRPTVQFSSRWYLCVRKIPYGLHPVSQKFPQRCLWNGSDVRLTDDGPLSSFEGRSSSASSFHASLLQAVDGVMSLCILGSRSTSRARRSIPVALVRSTGVL